MYALINLPEKITANQINRKFQNNWNFLKS